MDIAQLPKFLNSGINSDVSAALALKQNILKTISVLTSSGGVASIDLSLPVDIYTITLTENTTLSFTNYPAHGFCKDIEIESTQHASAAKTFIISGITGKTAGGAWTQSTTLGAIEVLGIRAKNGSVTQLFPSGILG